MASDEGLETEMLQDGCLRTIRSKVWEAKAGDNIEEWGEQRLDTLLLAAQEEMGELTQAFLEYRAEDGDLARMYDELDDLGALLIQIEKQIDAHRGTIESEVNDD